MAPLSGGPARTGRLTGVAVGRMGTIRGATGVIGSATAIVNYGSIAGTTGIGVNLSGAVTLVNGGSIRGNAAYGPGPLTKRDILTLLPFENPIVEVEVTGVVLRAALEHGVSALGEEREPGRFPQVSGLRFAYDGRRPAGSRVTAASVNGKPLEDSKTYTLALSAFLLAGGDGYKMFRGARILVSPEEGPVEFAVVLAALAAAGEIAPRVEGRIERADLAPS